MSSKSNLERFVLIFRLKLVAELIGREDGKKFHEVIYWYEDDYEYWIYRQYLEDDEELGSQHLLTLHDFTDVRAVDAIIHMVRNGYTDEDIDNLRDIACI